MNDLAYSGINTTVRILEQQLLSKDIMNSLLASKELQQALEVLQKTDYGFQTDELLQTKQFDAVLMKHLKNQYEELYELMPTPELLDIFSIRYTYHNLKVLLKEKFAKKDFSHLLVPIGRYSLATLKQLVETRDSQDVPSVMVKAVREAYEDFENFERLETADVFMDTYYFKHLRMLERELQDDKVTEFVNLMIDLENIATLIRASAQKQSRSFLQTVLSNEGTVSKTQLIDTFQELGWASLLQLFDGVSYKEELESILSQENISVLKLELLKDECIYRYLKDATFDAFGPYPSLAYIHASEMEVKNIRLILVGIDNGFSEEQLRERMRPVYGS